MLNISGINSGYVIDHIPAGLSMSIYNYLNLGKYDHQIAIIKNARSSKMGKKDIIKIEGIPENLNLELLSIFGDNITVNVIVDGVIKDKLHPSLPETVNNIFVCKNPHIFKLTDKVNRTYRCTYCEQAYKMNK